MNAVNRPNGHYIKVYKEVFTILWRETIWKTMSENNEDPRT